MSASRPARRGTWLRAARQGDLAQVITIDRALTGFAKPDYWRAILRRYGGRGRRSLFLVAERGTRIEGYVIAEVRDWEFGSPPCGWVFTIAVRPGAREAGVGTVLLEAVVDAFRRQGIATVRTLVARDNHLVLSFFRSQGMMAAPVIPLEKIVA